MFSWGQIRGRDCSVDGIDNIHNTMYMLNTSRRSGQKYIVGFEGADILSGLEDVDVDIVIFLIGQCTNTLQAAARVR